MGVETPPVPPTNEGEKGKKDEVVIMKPPGTGGEGSSGSALPEASDGTARKPGQCMPKSIARPKLTIRSPSFRDEVQHLKDHALIGKFIGLWPNEKALIWWINTTWKPQGHYDLQLGAKGFFTVIFFNIEDRVRIFDNGPYFFHSAGLYLRTWKERFNPDTENMTIAPVWLRLYSLPTEFWKEEILKDIGNTLGDFVKISEQTKQAKFVSYARLCVYLDISQDLPEAIELTHDDEDWVQAIDYEQLPFRCRRCHEHGHLFRDCPLNKPQGNSGTSSENKDGEGFIKVTNRKRAAKRGSGPEVNKKSQTQNRFAVLQVDASSDPKQTDQVTQKEKEETSQDPKQKAAVNQEVTMEDKIPMEEESEAEDMSIGELDLDGLEAAFASNQPKDITPQQVNLLEKAIIRLKTGKNLGVGSGTPKELEVKRKGKKEKRGRPTNTQRIHRLGRKLIDSGQYPTIEAAFKP